MASSSNSFVGFVMLGFMGVGIAASVVVSVVQGEPLEQALLSVSSGLGKLLLGMVALYAAGGVLFGIGAAVVRLLETRNRRSIARQGPNHQPAPLTYPHRSRRAGLEIQANGTLRSLDRRHLREISLPDCVKFKTDVDIDGVGPDPYIVLVDRYDHEFTLGPANVANDEFRRAFIDFCPFADIKDPDIGCTPLELIAGTSKQVGGKIETIGFRGTWI